MNSLSVFGENVWCVVVGISQRSSEEAIRSFTVTSFG